MSAPVEERDAAGRTCEADREFGRTRGARWPPRPRCTREVLHSSRLASLLTRLDQFPKLGLLAELLVFAGRQLRAEEEVSQRVFVKHPVHYNSFRDALEVNPVIFRPVAEELLALSLQHTKPRRVQIVEVFGEHFKLGQEIQLQIFWQRRHFAST